MKRRHKFRREREGESWRKLEGIGGVQLTKIQLVHVWNLQLINKIQFRKVQKGTVGGGTAVWNKNLEMSVLTL